MSYRTTSKGQWACKTPEYRAWDRMKQRCYAPSYRGKKNYSGRGIKVCDEWMHDFEAFLDHVGYRPSSDHSLDRIDNNSNYEPGNVRWATLHQQHANTRANNRTVGVQKHGSGWIARLRVDGKQVLSICTRSYKHAVRLRKEAEKEYGVAI